MRSLLYPTSLTFASVKAAAQHRWQYILPTAGIPDSALSGKHTACPIENAGRDRFRWDNKSGSGSFICTRCGAGDGFKLVQLFRGCSPSEALHLVADILGNRNIGCLPRRKPATVASPSTDKQAIESRKNLLHRTWNESQLVAKDDPVWMYLVKSRGLVLDVIPNVLRYHPALSYFDDGKYLGKFSAMVAKIQNLDGEIVSLHRTYLTVDGQKAFGDKSKKFMTPTYERAVSSAAICLYPAAETLVLAEGIETSLCGAIALELPSWAAVSAHGLSVVKLPDTVRKVIVLVDNDESNAGQQAAAELTHRLIGEGRMVKQLMPPRSGCDWLDLLMKT